jgi:hypothetical protein
MNNNTTPIALLIERAEEYAQTKVELLRLEAMGTTAEVLSSLVSRLVVIITLSSSLLIISIGSALWIGKQLGEWYSGFFVIGGLYALLALIIYMFKTQLLERPVSNGVIRKLKKGMNHEK